MEVSGAQVTLAWDAPPSAVAAYELFFRIHDTADWYTLADDLPAAPATGIARLVAWSAAAALLALALARPQWGERPAEESVRTRDLVVALDVSDSMLCPDLRPTRLQRSLDGGASWTSNPVPFSGGDLQFLDASTGRILADRGAGAGSNAVELYQTSDGGTTWTQITGWTGSGVGDVRDLWFVNDHVGFMAYDSVAPLGTILRTINGGLDWEVITTPTNAGLNKVWAPSATLAYAVGEPQGGTSFVCKITEA